MAYQLTEDQREKVTVEYAARLMAAHRMTNPDARRYAENAVAKGYLTPMPGQTWRLKAPVRQSFVPADFTIRRVLGDCVVCVGGLSLDGNFVDTDYELVGWDEEARV